MLENYVKFVRGTSAAFENILVKDKDTLYFIREKGASTGKLYLGEVLISGGFVEGDSISIENIGDIVIDENVEDGSLLVYDAAQEKWVSKSASAVFTDVTANVLVGATAEEDGIAGLVPTPKAGENNLFLRGDGIWAAPVGKLSDEDLAKITALDSKVDSLIGDNSTTDEEGNVVIPSIKQVVTETLTELLVKEDASEAFDTLEEVSAWIKDHPEDAAAMNADIQLLQTSVGNLEDLLNDSTDEEGNTVKGLVSRVADLESAIGSEGAFVLQTVYAKEVGDITQLYGTDENGDTVETNLVSEIKSINERLAWKDID